ncbi:MAG: hypothetical protein F6J94_19470 [Moorea sp. SIO1F2]|uniref:hypothetical protein n=1 Tax=unclassified Moorena TaxID=2683338 RepID=UPI0013BB15F0|nr:MULTISPECIES: hypothetical protein [unclassified Moorena]NEN95882.1 hypothetical protein [Moorena sp. SIO3I7]NEO09694.1 hypothetical protein [Moorena sp. SIO3I8]NEO18269.1 hypothetical protein [Moorena sp. SIO4A5]NEP25694.1 hypothetical protein [Moorena sp. SIO3I6]NEQ57360.1 hypothetical protein [Moorena sp. SIO4A1]
MGCVTYKSDAEVRPVANLITGQTHHYGLGEAVRSWGSPPLAVCRGFPHERLHQDTGITQRPCHEMR